MIGQTISHYKILEKLGEGGMGVVYKAQDTKLDRLVALKFLPPEYTRDQDAKQRFIHEAKAASSLDHPNICNVHEVDETPDGQLFIAMAIYDGASLSKKIEKSPLKIEEVLDIATQIAEGLQTAHEKGITHRDIKSSNVIVTEKGRAIIMDFGLARSAGASKLTKTGSTLGTVPYMSPEQARGEKVDHRSDIWSLGAVIYEMVSGQLPFKSQYNDAIVYSILNENHQPLTALRSGLPMDLETIVNKCLEKNPADRYQHIDELIVDLRKVKGEAGKGVVNAKTSLLVKSKSFIYAGSVAVLLLLVFLALPLFKGSEQTIRSIAVLPLENLSRDPEQEYFADGMTEVLITDLAKISALRVISRTSVMHFKATKKTIPEIAKELNVDAVVEGSVQRSGDRVRITAQLLHAPTDRHLWAESYERNLTDILALQSELALAIVKEIRAKITPQEKIRLTNSRPVNKEAYELYLKGREHLHKLTVPDLETALHYFELALLKDPKSALACTGVSAVWSGRQQMGYVPSREAVPKAKAAAAQALALDSTLSEAHHRLAAIKTWSDWDWAGGEREFQRAIDLDPNYSEARAFYSLFLSIMKRPEEAITQMERALELDPFSDWLHALYGSLLTHMGRHDEAIEQFIIALRTAPGNPLAQNGLKNAYSNKGMYKEALSAEMSAQAARGDREMVASLERGNAEAGYRGAMRRAAETLAARSRATYIRPSRVAAMYVQAGDNDHALEWLQKSYEARDPNLPYISVGRAWDPVRREPRFKALLKKMRFEK